MRLRRLGLSSCLGLAAIGLLRTRRQRCVLHACFAAAGSHAQPPAPRGSVPGRPASRRRCLRAPPRLLARGRTRRRSCAAHLWLPNCACSRRGTPDDRGARASAVASGGTAACSCSLGQRRPRSAPRSVHRGVRTFVAPTTGTGPGGGGDRTLCEACARRRARAALARRLNDRIRAPLPSHVALPAGSAPASVVQATPCDTCQPEPRRVAYRVRSGMASGRCGAPCARCAGAARRARRTACGAAAAAERRAR